MAYTDAASTPASPGALSGSGITLGARVEMYPAMPMPVFNTMGGPAFAARFKSDGASDLIAILCNTGMPPRTDALASMKNIDHPSLLRLADSGVLLWPDDNAHYFAIAYQRFLDFANKPSSR